MTWQSNGDLGCSTCSAVFEFPGPRVEVLYRARAHGWHVYNGMSLTLKPLESHLCPACIGSARKRIQDAERFEDETPLFDIKADIQAAIDARAAKKVAANKARTTRNKDEDDSTSA